MQIPEVTLQISANTVAWYAAVIATGALLVSGYNAWRDRSRIKITYKKEMIVVNAIPPYSEHTKYFSINIVNTGRRPVAIGNVGIKLFKGGSLLLGSSVHDQHTRILSEEKPDTSIMTEQDLVDFSMVHYIQVYDKTGREYRKYFYTFPTFDKIIYLIKNYDKK